QTRDEAGREMLRGKAGPIGDRVSLSEGHEVIAKGFESAFGRESRLEVVKPSWPIGIVLNVLTAVPEELYRSAGQLRDHYGLDHVVALQPAPESAAHAGHVHGDLACAHAERLRHQFATPARVLRRRPDLDTAVAFIVRRAVLRLEIDVRQEWICVRAFQYAMRVGERLIDIPVASNHGLRLLPRKELGPSLELRRALPGVGLPIPDHLQLFERLLRLPPRVGDDSYTI